jgi:hypothetical protein
MSAPTRGRILLAWTVVVVTVIAVWKFIDYRNQPPKVIPYVVWDR